MKLCGEEKNASANEKDSGERRRERARIVHEQNVYSIKVSIVMKKGDVLYDAERYSSRSISHSLARSCVCVCMCECGCQSCVKTIMSFVLLHCVHSIGKFSANTHTRTAFTLHIHLSFSLCSVLCANLLKCVLCVYNIGTSTYGYKL